MQQGVVKDPEILKVLKTSSKIKNKNHALAEFFNNTSMGRILDIFIENKNTWINIGDFITVGDLSRKSIRVNTDVLLEHGLIERDIRKYYTFFKWNSANERAKHLEKLSNILVNA